MAVCPFLQPVLAEALLSISSLVFMLQPLLKTQMNLICDYQVMLSKEWMAVLMPQQKCNLAFSWLAWACEGGSGSWKPNLAALVGLPDENLVKEYCHHFCRAHFSLELTDVWRAFLWGLGALHCLCSVGSSRKSRLVMQVLISLGFVCQICLDCWDRSGELSSPLALGYSYRQGNGVCSSMVDKSQGLQEAHYLRRED